MDVLQLDVSGRPQAWISPREAAVLYACDAIAWTLGDAFHVLRGGIQRSTGRRAARASAAATPARHSSPAWWPCRSLKRLKKSMSTSSSASVTPSRCACCQTVSRCSSKRRRL